MAGVIMLGFDGSSFAMDARDLVEGPERRDAREGREECRGDSGGDATDDLSDSFGDMAMLNYGMIRYLQGRGTADTYSSISTDFASALVDFCND